MSDTPLSLTLFGVAVAFYVAALIGFIVYVPLRRRRIAGTPRKRSLRPHTDDATEASKVASS